mmetsp:Transcript_43504/g.137177  ORF Transcript_43504/g.137177 Transcript_43504/m.137177 type:complete len:285 (+) Transcript_43504:244-1098(+)
MWRLRRQRAHLIVLYRLKDRDVLFHRFVLRLEAASDERLHGAIGVRRVRHVASAAARERKGKQLCRHHRWQWPARCSGLGPRPRPRSLPALGAGRPPPRHELHHRRGALLVALVDLQLGVAPRVAPGVANRVPPEHLAALVGLRLPLARCPPRCLRVPRRARLPPLASRRPARGLLLPPAVVVAEALHCRARALCSPPRQQATAALAAFRLALAPAAGAGQQAEHPPWSRLASRVDPNVAAVAEPRRFLSAGAERLRPGRCAREHGGRLSNGSAATNFLEDCQV